MPAGLREWFAGKLGGALPLELTVDLLRAEQATGDVFASEDIRGSLQHPPMIPEFREEPGDYAIAGLWGRSLNTYAFYFVERRGPHRRFFRVHAGGAYGDFQKESERVRSFLAGYEAWRKRYEPKLQASLIVHNMGVDHAELVLASGATITADNGDEDADWWKLLGARVDAG